LGGKVILDYLASYGFSDEGARVKHVVTLDSPVNGIDNRLLLILGHNLHIVSDDYYNGTTVEYLRTHHVPAIVAQNIDLAKRLDRHGTKVLTIGSTNDIAVPADPTKDGNIADSLIGPYSLPLSLSGHDGCGPFDYAACVGHSQVLQDQSSLMAIQKFLQSPVTPNPNPTPNPTSPPPHLASTRLPSLLT